MNRGRVTDDLDGVNTLHASSKCAQRRKCTMRIAQLSAFSDSPSPISSTSGDVQPWLDHGLISEGNTIDVTWFFGQRFPLAISLSHLYFPPVDQDRENLLICIVLALLGMLPTIYQVDEDDSSLMAASYLSTLGFPCNNNQEIPK